MTERVNVSTCQRSNVPTFRYDPEDAWVKKHRLAYLALAEAAGWDDFLVGHPCFLPANDLISMHLGTDRFLIHLLDDPAGMQGAILQGARDLLRARLDAREAIRNRHAFWYGNAGWMSFWAPEPFVASQSDVSCMLSPEQFEQFIVPELEVYGQAFGALWYHLDGGNARQHLSQLLSLPYLRVVQYVPAPWEPPNGSEHLDLYREIQKAGKIVHVALSPEHIELLLRDLDPGLLMLETRCDGVQEGQDLLECARRWIRSSSF